MKRTLIATGIIITIAIISFVLLAYPHIAKTPTTDTASATTNIQEDFIGLTETEASALATEQNIPFRVVLRDTEPLLVDMEYVPGRINAVVENNAVTSVSIEGEPNETDETIPPPVTPAIEPVSSSSDTHQQIIGMTQAEAESYANTVGTPLRPVVIDGEPQPVTMDYVPGRINASIVDGVVTEYTVEGIMEDTNNTVDVSIVSDPVEAGVIVDYSVE